MAGRPARCVVFAFALAAAAGCSGSPVAPTPVTSSSNRGTTTLPVSAAPHIAHVRYLAFGDSLTGGTTSPAISTMGAGLPTSYPFKLQAQLTTRYRDQTIDVSNEGKPGEAAQDGVVRFPTALETSAPDVVILLEGVNDVSLYGVRSIPRVTGYLQTMARAARQRGADVIICTEPPQRVGGFRPAEPGVIAAYNQSLRELAAAEGAQLVDFETSVDLALIGADGLHPTEDGYARMAAVLFEAIRQRYELAP